MNHEYSCDIIRDLLPGYIDGVSSKAGAEAVEGHLAECAQCSQFYAEMRETLGEENQITLKEQAAVDGLKKIKKRTRHLKIAVAFVSGMLGTALLVFFLSFYVVGSIQSTGQVTAREFLYDEETGSLTIKGTLNSASMRVSRVICKENASFENRIDVSVYAAELLPFQQEEQEFSITIPNAKGQKVYLVGEDYDQFEAYNWEHYHNELMLRLEEEIYNWLPPEWTRDNVFVHYAGGVETVDGVEGFTFWVDVLTGDEDAYYWRFGDTVVTHGGILESAGFDVWISEEEPHRILIHDYRTGEHTEDFPF